MSYTLVVGAAPVLGQEEFYRGLLTGAAQVVAADAAGEWCAGLGRLPDAAIGDFDGSTAGAPARLRARGAFVEEYPVGKDATDLELAVDHALTAWGDPIVVTAAFTARIDHTLAAFGALLRAGAGARVLEPGWSAHIALDGSSVRLDPEAGVTVSVVALRGAPSVTISGAEWLLDNVTLDTVSGLGVSNRALGGPFTVDATNGMVAVIVLERG